MFSKEIKKNRPHPTTESAIPKSIFSAVTINRTKKKFTLEIQITNNLISFKAARG